tara:strand:+ start:87 stop:353 length:267 start_codon:yes stop_codon:yes gene_type:complete
MPKYEVGVYRTSFNSVYVEADTEQEAKDFALRLEGTGKLELFPDKRAEATIEDSLPTEGDEFPYTMGTVFEGRAVSVNEDRILPDWVV